MQSICALVDSLKCKRSCEISAFWPGSNRIVGFGSYLKESIVLSGKLWFTPLINIYYHIEALHTSVSKVLLSILFFSPAWSPGCVSEANCLQGKWPPGILPSKQYSGAHAPVSDHHPLWHVVFRLDLFFILMVLFSQSSANHLVSTGSKFSSCSSKDCRAPRPPSSSRVSGNTTPLHSATQLCRHEYHWPLLASHHNYLLAPQVSLSSLTSTV